MPTRSDRARRVAVLTLALGVTSGCGLDPPPPVIPIDCEQVDRAMERFPDECADAASDDDAATDVDADVDAGVDVDGGGP
jgi:hypothetical protein